MLNDEYLLSFFRSQLSEGVTLVPFEDGFRLSLPFTDSMGDRIEVFIVLQDNEVTVDDFGHTAGLLFQLGQHGRDSVGHQLVRNLSEAYDIIIDFNRGVLFKTVSKSDLSRIIDYIKVITSIKTVLPEMRHRKRERRTGRRLGTLLGRQVRQLRLPHLVSHQAEVEGKNETWVVDYRYLTRVNGERRDIIIVTADLEWGEPREKAAHVVTLAMDVLGSRDNRDLRIVYDVGQNGNGLAARKAASLIEDNRDRIGYNAYNYSDSGKRLALFSLLHQELSPMSWQHGQ